jgi:hypothetical protein
LRKLGANMVLKKASFGESRKGSAAHDWKGSKLGKRKAYDGEA